MLEILRERAAYVIRRGATLNNPHIKKSFLDALPNKITSRHATRLVELVQEALELEAKGIEPAGADIMREAAADPAFVRSQESTEETDEATE